MSTGRKGRGALRGKRRMSTSTQSPMRQALISNLWEVKNPLSMNDGDEKQ